MIAAGRLGGLRRRRARRRHRGAVRSRAFPRPSLRVVVACIGVIALLAVGWLWLRDSSLVSVDRVSVTGQSGPDAAQIRTALIAAARNMTTLDVRMDQLRTAVAPYPVVKDLRVSTQFPHGIRIRVIEQIPVGAVTAGGRTIAVAGDGTLLHDVVVSARLPMIPLRVPPGGSRLTDGDALRAVAVLAAAPWQLLARVTQVTTISGHGLAAELRSGPTIYFGDAGRLAAKWIAASEVLADRGSAGAAYIDVTDPERPAAGGGPSSAAGGTAASGTAAGAGTASTASGAASQTASGNAPPGG
jgi:cell division protein FtsQ